MPKCISQIEVLNPLNGHLYFSIPNVTIDDTRPGSDALIGLHLFARKKQELASR